MSHAHMPSVMVHCLPCVINIILSLSHTNCHFFFSLCAPARDPEIKARQSELEALLSTPNLTFTKFVVPFLKAFHVTVDDIEVCHAMIV